MNPAFQIGHNIGSNFSNSIARVKDENAIESILSEAMGTGDPQVLQNSIGKILSQVSPERQNVALQYLQNAHTNILKKQEQKKLEEQGRQAAKEGGYTYGAPPQVQAQQIKGKQLSPQEKAAQITADAKKERLASVYGSGGSSSPQIAGAESPGVIASSAVQPPFLPGKAPNQPQQPQQAIPKSPFRDMTEDQLIIASGSEDRQISEPAKQEIRRRQEEIKANKSNFEPESDKLEAKRVAELATEIESEYKAAQNEDLRLDRMGVLDQKGNVSTPLLIKALDFLHLPIGVLSNPDTEEYRKLEADFVRDVSKVFPGGKITNYELQSYLKTIPGLLNSPEGRKAIIRNRKLLNDAKKIRYDEYKKILKENNGKKPPNLSLLIEERTASQVAKLEDEFIDGITKESEKFQQPIRMKDPDGNPIDIPPNMIEKAMKAGARF